jgi:hypothetical protein
MKSSGLAVASMVLGIVAVVFDFIFLWVGLICAIIALILGIVAKNQISNSNGQIGGGGMATTGIVLGAVALLLWLIVLIACSAIIGGIMSGAAAF